MKKNICAVVVTYNRKDLLKECLSAILNQSLPLDKVLVINNASTDGTAEMLKNDFNVPTIEVVSFDKNLGGAGGFYEGLRIARERKFDYVWIMDDDTIPTSLSLEELIKAANFLNDKNRKFSFLASTVFGGENEFMNVPALSEKPSQNGYPYWYEFLSRGIVNVKSATFVSLLICVDAIQLCGLPCKDYFIWGDDVEYTTRLTRYYGDAYFVGSSVVIHKRINARALDITTENDINRIRMYHYFYRNVAINTRFYCGKNQAFMFCLKTRYKFLKMKDNGYRKIIRKTVFRGLKEYKKEFKRFSNYILSQISNKE